MNISSPSKCFLILIPSYSFPGHSEHRRYTSLPYSFTRHLINIIILVLIAPPVRMFSDTVAADRICSITTVHVSNTNTELLNTTVNDYKVMTCSLTSFQI